VGRTGAHLVTRAASFMLLADSQASFEIEGERPPRNRLEQWGQAILEAGKNPLTLDEIIRLQRVLIEDTRFVGAGLRLDGVFLGDRDQNGDPLPEFVGARPQDLDDLMSGMLEANGRMREDGVDPVLKATATAFGFVYVHPFQDGNGRMHRCLIHHVLAERRLTPPGMVFPVSSVMSSTSSVRVLVRRMTGQNRAVPRRLSRTRCRFERRGLPVKYALDSSRSIALELGASFTSIVRPLNSSQRYHARRAVMPVGAARTMASISVCGATSKARFRVKRSMSDFGLIARPEIIGYGLLTNNRLIGHDLLV
jgi:hypothetical protein